MRPKKIAMQVRINEDLASQIKKAMPLWQESLGAALPRRGHYASERIRHSVNPCRKGL